MADRNVLAQDTAFSLMPTMLRVFGKPEALLAAKRSRSVSIQQALVAISTQENFNRVCAVSAIGATGMEDMAPASSA